MAIYEQSLFKKLDAKEFIGQKWNRENKEELAPHILEYSNHFNTVAYWVIEKILNESTPERRAKLIDILIQIMLHSYSLNNFMALFEIVSALNSTAIYRLSKTWHLVTKSRIRAFWIFSKFTNAGYSIYKKDIRNVRIEKKK